MALKIAKTNEVGVSTTYHKVAKISVDFDRLRVHAVLYHYVNEDYRKNSAEANAHISSFSAVFAPGQLNGNLREAVYNALKQTEEYAGAEDV